MSANEKRLSVALRVHSQLLTAAEISHLLQASPSRSYEKGIRYSPRNEHSGLREEAIWILESSCSAHLSLSDHLTALLNFLESRRELLVSMHGKCQIDVFCGYMTESGQGGFVRPVSCYHLPTFPINVLVDLYLSPV